MAFYITPPGGNISLQKLTHYAVIRLKFLFKVMDTGGDRLRLLDVVRETETVLNSECLIEGSVKDKISHFMLRLAAFGEPRIRSFLVTAETLLFDFRFSCMTADELCRLFRSLDFHIHSQRSKSQSHPSSAFQAIVEIFAQIKKSFVKWKTLVMKYLSGDAACFHVPFQTVPQLVTKRQVVLQGGIASVPVCRLREVVTSLFRDLLQLCLQARSRFQSEDERMRRLVRGLKYQEQVNVTSVDPNQKTVYHERYPDDHVSLTEPGSLSHAEVDDNMTYCPPCMLNAHTVLRQKHRLKHHTRIQYTLFLKEVGLPVHEALMFWRKEYSMSPSNRDGCSHDWSRDEKRYTYNIRHLYGLEGSRINYRGHSCVALQEDFHGTTEEGGCPFSHFDSPHLIDLLATEGIHGNHQQHIVEVASSGEFSQACQLFFKYKVYSAVSANHHESSSCAQLAPHSNVSTDGERSYCSTCKQSSITNTVAMETCEKPSLADGVIMKTCLKCKLQSASHADHGTIGGFVKHCNDQESLNSSLKITNVLFEKTKDSSSINMNDCKQRIEQLDCLVNKSGNSDWHARTNGEILNSRPGPDISSLMHSQHAVEHNKGNAIIKLPADADHQCNGHVCSKQFEEMDQDQGIPHDADNDKLGPFCVKCNTLLGASQVVQTKHRQAAVCIACASIKDVKTEPSVELYSSDVTKPEEMDESDEDSLPHSCSHAEEFTSFPERSLNLSGRKSHSNIVEMECSCYNGDHQTTVHRSDSDPEYRDVAQAEMFFKPIDYYRSYKKLMEGLETESPR